MGSKVLSIKHWQLFLFVFLIPFLFQLFCISNVFEILMESIPDKKNPDLTRIARSYSIFFAISFITMLMFSIWIWVIVTKLIPLIPESVKMSVFRFKMFVIFPIIYFLFIGVVSNYFYNSFDEGTIGQSSFMLITLAMFPLHIFAIYCMFHNIYFTAKTIKSVELQKTLSFSDFAAEFLLLWFYPIGVWIIQPKVLKLLSSKNHIEEDNEEDSEPDQ
jgi:hypothetical protein